MPRTAEEVVDLEVQEGLAQKWRTASHFNARRDMNPKLQPSEPVAKRALPSRFWTRNRIPVVVALVAALGWLVVWPPVRAAAERRWVRLCVVHHADHPCAPIRSAGEAVCRANPQAYADKPAPVMHQMETVPSCVTSYVYYHRSYSGTFGLVVMQVGWLAIAALCIVVVRRRRPTMQA